MAAARNEFRLCRGTEEYNRSAVTPSCRLSPEISAVNMEIRCFKETRCVCVYKNGHVTEGRGYEGRVSLFTQEMERGNVSLQLRDCRGSDFGYYLCQVTDGDRTEEITVEMMSREARSPSVLWARSPSVLDFFTPRWARSHSWARSLLEARSLLFAVTVLGARSLLFAVTEFEVHQRDRKWTEDERVEMEKSARLIDEFRLICPRSTEEYNRSAVTLSCRLYPEISAVNMEIRWFKETRCVCVYKNGHVTEGRGYEGRVSLFTQEMERGNVSLQLRDCRESDFGYYLCQVTDGDRTEEITVLMRASVLDFFTLQWARSPSVLDFFTHFEVHQGDREWTEDERVEMEKSALLTDEFRLIRSSGTERFNPSAVTLSCRLYPEISAVNMEIRWFKGTRCVCVYKNGHVTEGRGYEGRVSLFTQEMERGNVSLQLRDCTRSDFGYYLCQVTDGDRTEEITVLMRASVLGAVSVLGARSHWWAESDSGAVSVFGVHQGDREWTEDERLEMEKSARLTVSGATQDSAAPIRRRNSMDGRRPTLGGESSSPHSPVSVPVAELRLVLLGRTGSGKTAAGNTILGREERNQADTSTDTSTSTQQSESTQGEVARRKVTVVDTPDWFSPGLSLEKLRQDVGHCVRLCAPGPHAFLLVIPVKQPTGEGRGTLEKMEEMFGERCWRNTMIIFSVTDELQKKNIEDVIQAGNQEVLRFVEKCGNRFHCLNIEESGDGSQVSELLEKIEKMVEGSREKFYSSEIYLETESQIRAMETKILKEIEEKSIREMEMKEKIKKEVQDSLRKIEGVIQEHEGDIRQLNDRTSELERKMKEEKDEEKKRELEKELKREVERRTEMEGKVKKLKEKRERERREMEERHQQEMEEIREVYEGEVRMETERNLMKIILPELQRNILASKMKMQEEFNRQMEEKNRELESFKQRLSVLTETQSA